MSFGSDEVWLKAGDGAELATGLRVGLWLVRATSVTETSIDYKTGQRAPTDAPWAVEHISCGVLWAAPNLSDALAAADALSLYAPNYEGDSSAEFVALFSPDFDRWLDACKDGFVPPPASITGRWPQ